MQEGNSKPNKTAILEAVKELQQDADCGMVKNDLLDMYKASLTDDMSNLTATQRVERFHSFQNLYNFLLKIEMVHDANNCGRNLLVS